MYERDFYYFARFNEMVNCAVCWQFEAKNNTGWTFFFKQLKYWWKYEYGYWMKISMKEILLLCTFHSAGRAPCWQLGENLQIFDRDNKTWKCCISFKIISNWTLFRCKKMIEKDIILCTIMNIWIQSSNIWSQLLPFICKPIKRFAQILACS